MQILKTIMCVLNGLIFLAGGGAVCGGVLVKVKSKFVLTMLNQIKDSSPVLSQLGNTSYLVIAVGIILAVIGFIGCFGAISENKCILRIFFTTVLIVSLAEVAGTTFVLLFPSMAKTLLTGISQKVVLSIKSSYGENEVYTAAWNVSMNLMKCCGFNDYTDFTDSPFTKQTLKYPTNCCHEKPELCSWLVASSKNIPGCFSAVVKLLKENSGLIAGVGSFTVVIEVFAMIVSVILCRR